MRISLWGIPTLLVGLVASFIVIEQVESAPPAIATLREILSNGGYWFIPAVLIGLWLAVLLGAVRGVGLGISIGLLTLGLCRLGFPLLPDELILHWLNPTVPMTLGGTLGGLIGGLLDKPRGTSRTWEHSWSVRLALVGAGVGFGAGFCAFAPIAGLI